VSVQTRQTFRAVTPGLAQDHPYSETSLDILNKTYTYGQIRRKTEVQDQYTMRIQVLAKACLYYLRVRYVIHDLMFRVIFFTEKNENVPFCMAVAIPEDA